MTDRVLGHGGAVCKDKHCETCADLRETKKTPTKEDSK